MRQGDLLHRMTVLRCNVMHDSADLSLHEFPLYEC
jgi:hypothetical protein